MFEKFIHSIVGIFPEGLQKLYYKYESALLYIFFGALTTAVSIGSQYAAYALGAGTSAATVISWLFAVTFAFFTNKVWVFGSKSFEKRLFFREFFSFYAARLFSLASELLFMYITTELLMWDKYLMKIIAQFFVLVLNYIFSRFLIFRKKKKEVK